jgi:hypothetical protein
MPEQYGFRWGRGARIASLGPIAASFGFFVLFGGIVLALYESRNAARHADGVAARAQIDAKIEANMREINAARQIAERAIAGHREIDRKLDLILSRLPPGLPP